MSSTQSRFQSEFIKRYLQFGLGALSKSDIDALVMFLLDRYGTGELPALSKNSNQTVSEILRAPASKIKKLRYEAALKFGGPVQDEAKSRLLAALTEAVIEPEGEKIRLIIEDALAKNWLQGQLKQCQSFFDHSFNTEIVFLSPEGLFKVLENNFSPKEIATFRKNYDRIKGEQNSEKRNQRFKEIAMGLVKKILESSPTILAQYL